MGKREKVITILSIALLIGIGFAIVGNQIHKKRIAELEEIIKEKEEKIKQLEQDEKIRQQKIENKQAAQAGDKDIAEGFLKTWKIVVGRDAPYRDVVVSSGVMRIYFSDDYEANAFINFNPEVIARFALEYLLKETGSENGMVEYYTPLKRKIFSISGSLSSVETKRY